MQLNTTAAPRPAQSALPVPHRTDVAQRWYYLLSQCCATPLSCVEINLRTYGGEPRGNAQLRMLVERLAELGLLEELRMHGQGDTTPGYRLTALGEAWLDAWFPRSRKWLGVAA